MNYRFKGYALTASGLDTLSMKALLLTVIVFHALPLHILPRFIVGAGIKKLQAVPIFRLCRHLGDDSRRGILIALQLQGALWEICLASKCEDELAQAINAVKSLHRGIEGSAGPIK